MNLAEVIVQEEFNPESSYVVKHRRATIRSSYSQGFLFGGNEMVQFQRRKKLEVKKLCECGCGQEVKPGNRFVQGHQNRSSEWEDNKRQIYCKCGCGELTAPGRIFISGHNGRVMSNETKEKCGKSFKGKHHSNKTKKLMSEIAKNRSPETIEKIATANRGKVRSAETRKKISESKIGQKPWCTGKKLTKEHILKRSLKRIKCRQIEGGYSDIWFDRDYVNDIRGTACGKCGITNAMSIHLFGSLLCTHHKDFNKTNSRPNNIQTICRSCHPKIHNKYKRNDNENPIE
jgi:hypothetical protein